MTEDLLEKFNMQFNTLLTKPVYNVEQQHKESLLLPILNSLHLLHHAHCSEYQNIVGSLPEQVNSLDALPYLAVRLFKHLKLSSIGEREVFRVLQSSGTTSQIRSQIILDAATSERQSKVLVKILQDTIGRARLPMLIIDSPAILKDKSIFNARAAGIQGLAFFGRDHTYALDENMNLDWPKVSEFCQKYQGQSVLIFGFTFMIWLHFVEALQASKRTINLPEGIMLHSGGWKNLESQKVDNAHFKSTVKGLTGVTKIHNFYGMAEQVGSIFVECQAGRLHAPVFADVIVRDPFSFSPLPHGEPGLIQVLSALPTSYPGHSILTEDMGKILGVDNCACGRAGKYFQVLSRLPKTEVRGCSDTHKGISQ